MGKLTLAIIHSLWLAVVGVGCFHILFSFSRSCLVCSFLSSSSQVLGLIFVQIVLSFSLHSLISEDGLPSWLVYAFATTCGYPDSNLDLTHLFQHLSDHIYIMNATHLSILFEDGLPCWLGYAFATTCGYLDSNLDLTHLFQHLSDHIYIMIANHLSILFKFSVLTTLV